MYPARFHVVGFPELDALIKPEDASGHLKKLYNKYQRSNETVANILQAHSLRPHTLEGHMAFFRVVKGHSANVLPLWFLEAVGVYVSGLNECEYCIDHHSQFGGLAFDGTEKEWSKITEALLKERPETVFSVPRVSLIHYAGRVTRDPASITQSDILALKSAGALDGEILEVNQVAGYFAYANRTVLGLGISLSGEIYAE